MTIRFDLPDQSDVVDEPGEAARRLVEAFGENARHQEITGVRSECEATWARIDYLLGIKEKGIEFGAVVTPQGSFSETIIGIVFCDNDDDVVLPTVDVLWLSSSRGAFWCSESPGDLNVAPLADRHDMSDPRVDHAELARLILEMDR